MCALECWDRLLLIWGEPSVHSGPKAEAGEGGGFCVLEGPLCVGVNNRLAPCRYRACRADHRTATIVSLC